MAEEATTTTTTEATPPAQTEGTAPPRDNGGRFTTPDDSPLAWHATLPAELRESPTLQQYKSLHDAAKGLVEKDRLIGRSIQLPQKGLDEDAEGWGRVFEKLGRPADPKGYELDLPELPEGWEWSPDVLQSFYEEAHAAGLTKAQAQRILNLEARRSHNTHNEQAGAAARMALEMEKTLNREFGADAPRVQDAARRAIELTQQGVFAGPEVGQRAWQKLQEAHLDKDPDVVRWLAEVHARTGEDRFEDGTPMPTTGNTMDHLQARSKELTDKKFAAHNGKGTWGPREQAEMDRVNIRIAELREGGQRRRSA